MVAFRDSEIPKTGIPITIAHENGERECSKFPCFQLLPDSAADGRHLATKVYRIMLAGYGNTTTSSSSPRLFRFGAFELLTATGELSKRGARVRLQIKPLQVLKALLEKPGELVTREELRTKLWPEGKEVDFESGLNTATNRLRAALNDSADAPRYVETLPRLGYRFICPVTAVFPETVVAKVEQPPQLSAIPAEMQDPELPSALRWLIRSYRSMFI
jgi:DNA-binding winged helix-turn-helix (wHTH) protein